MVLINQNCQAGLIEAVSVSLPTSVEVHRSYYGLAIPEIGQHI
jgi:hypothetical protein